MFQIGYERHFVREWKRLSLGIKKEAREKIELLKDPRNHEALDVHKLHGNLKGFYSFSVNYRIRIIFEFRPDKTIGLLAIGDHDLYR